MNTTCTWVENVRPLAAGRYVRYPVDEKLAAEKTIAARHKRKESLKEV